MRTRRGRGKTDANSEDGADTQPPASSGKFSAALGSGGFLAQESPTKTELDA